MPISIVLPDPAVMRVGKERYLDLAAGVTLHRLHPALYQSNAFNATDKGNARFSPIRAASGALIPTIYAAESFECATCEIILRMPDTLPIDPKTGLPSLQIVSPDDFKFYVHSELQTTCALKLVDLTIMGQRQIGVNHNGLLAGPTSSYPQTRAWAEKIHTACPDAQGLSYSSAQYGDHRAVVLFGDRVSADAMRPVVARSVADWACHDDICRLASTLSIDYEVI